MIEARNGAGSRGRDCGIGHPYIHLSSLYDKGRNSTTAVLPIISLRLSHLLDQESRQAIPIQSMLG